MIPTTFALFERIEVGGVAPVGAVSGQLGKIAVLLQICQRPLDGAAGEVHIPCNRLDPRPAASRAVGPILEIHIDRYSPPGSHAAGETAFPSAAPQRRLQQI